MKKSNPWVVLVVFFLFALLHQADRFLIGPLTSKIMQDFSINEAQMGLSVSSAIVVAGILYPIWGYISDRYNRAKLAALSSFLWGTTTWLSAIVRSYGAFVFTRASTGIDDAAYPGIYSLISDYFSPKFRSRVFSVMKTTYSLGFVLGAVFATTIGVKYGWRNVFYITGGFGILFSVLILLAVRDVPRGLSEHVQSPERMTLARIKEIMGKKTLLALYFQGFFAVFPTNIITFWLFRYLEVERGLSGSSLVLVTACAVASIGVGIPVAGLLGDKMFAKESSGRLKVGFLTAVGSVFLVAAIAMPAGFKSTFLLLISVGSFFSSFASPNVAAAISDVSDPGIRSSALAIQSFVETLGSAVSPAIAGVIAYKTSLTFTFISVLSISTVFWAIFFLIAIKNIKEDLRKRPQLVGQEEAQS